MVDPEDDGSGDADGGKEGVGAAVIAGVDTPPVLELAEHVFDPVTPVVENPVVMDRCDAVGFRRDARADASIGMALRNHLAS